LPTRARKGVYIGTIMYLAEGKLCGERSKRSLESEGVVDTQRSMDMQEPPYVVLIRTTCPFFFLFIFFQVPSIRKMRIFMHIL